MNIVLWVLQVLLAVHTAMGAVWKFSNSEKSVPSLAGIPHSLWLTLIAVEILCAVALVLPVLSKPLGILVPIAAGGIALEMLLFCGFHLFSGTSQHAHMIYWLVVAALCGFLIYGRLVLA